MPSGITLFAHEVHPSCKTTHGWTPSNALLQPQAFFCSSGRTRGDISPSGQPLSSVRTHVVLSSANNHPLHPSWLSILTVESCSAFCYKRSIANKFLGRVGQPKYPQRPIQPGVVLTARNTELIWEDIRARVHEEKLSHRPEV
jgi:hypothetical protein